MSLILLTNDDGIHAPGLAACLSRLRQIAEVVVVAPDSERSAVGHALTTRRPIHADRRPIGDHQEAWAVSGTPADCVKLALGPILGRKPDVVVSGINLGPNTGTNVVNSGTVSAAIEAAIHGIPSLAASLGTFRSPDFAFAAETTAAFARRLLTSPLPPGITLNLNVPNLPRDQIKGTVVARQGRSAWTDEYITRHDPRERPYHWLAGSYIVVDADLEYDARALEEGYVTITPLTFDLTAHHLLEELKDWAEIR